MNPKVSIITVTFNCRELLSRTLESIKSQSFRDFEHVVVDGGSTDGTVDLIQSSKNTIAWWISEKDNGIYDAMNKGLRAATGEYILFLNAGDTFSSPETLTLVPFAAFPDADIFYGETKITDSDGKPLGLRRKILPENLNWKHFMRGMVVCHQSVFVRKAVAPDYNPKYRYTADFEWVLLALKNSQKTIFTKTIISNFAEGGFSKQKQKESWAERFIIMKKYYGLGRTLMAHFVFAVNHVLVAMNIKKRYRESGF
jgi:glycosyltransferase involved in cell wall biosynthesis